MSETLYSFGKEGNLIGMLVTPEKKTSRAFPGVVFLNAGLLHRVGPYRQWVTLSRRLAESGVSSLRFDFSGLGDSQASLKNESDVERSKSDLAQALDFFAKKTGQKEFLLVGLCSGADYAHVFALEDKRVSGLVMIDAYGYKTPKYEQERLKKRWLSAKTWRNRAVRLMGGRAGEDIRAGRVNPETYVREFAPRQQVQGEVQRLAERGTQMLFIYTSGVSDYYNYAEQFWDMFGAPQGAAPTITRDTVKNRIETEYYPMASHTFTFMEDRERMSDRVTNWVLTREWRG